MRQNNGNNPTGEQMEGLLRMVADKMGKSPQELRQQLQSGQVENPQVQQLLQNPGELQRFLESAQVQRLLEELKKK